MGGGTWTTSSYKTYSTSRGYTYDTATCMITDDLSAQDMFKSKSLDRALDPWNVIRECCDTDEHPNTVPVILALDVTGSMGSAAVEVAKKLNVIMTKLYEKITDVEFLVMGIGDLSYDCYPIQASQFESDIRIAEQLDKIYFEFGGGGNSYESYTATWYFGSRHTKLDCWKRGKRGIIITIGDEQLNPYLPVEGRYSGLKKATGDNLQDNIETKDLYKETIQKFDIYHLDVDHKSYRYDSGTIQKSFEDVIGAEHFRRVTLDSITDEIIDIIINATNDSGFVGTYEPVVSFNENGEIAW